MASTRELISLISEPLNTEASEDTANDFDLSSPFSISVAPQAAVSSRRPDSAQRGGMSRRGVPLMMEAVIGGELYPSDEDEESEDDEDDEDDEEDQYGEDIEEGGSISPLPAGRRLYISGAGLASSRSTNNLRGMVGSRAAAASAAAGDRGSPARALPAAAAKGGREAVTWWHNGSGNSTPVRPPRGGTVPEAMTPPGHGGRGTKRMAAAAASRDAERGRKARREAAGAGLDRSMSRSGSLSPTGGSHKSTSTLLASRDSGMDLPTGESRAAPGPKSRGPKAGGRKGSVAGRPSKGSRSAATTTPQGHMCSACGITHTPLWRAGPEGPKTLCNACGVRFMKSGAVVKRG